MNKSFIKSMTAAVAGLGLVASCSHFNMGKDSHKCASGKCSSKKMEERNNKCGAANGCAAKKTVKTEVKSDVKTKTESKTSAKTEKKKN